jgi:exodeoxyribonuclease VII large subunit
LTNNSHIKLSELSQKVKEVINNNFSNIAFWVIADVSSHSFKQQTNYHYFKLVEKDENSNNILAQFDTKSWGNGSQKIQNFESYTGQKFTNNIHVLVKVIIEFHPTYGLQLQLVDIDTSFTLGIIEQKRQETLVRLVNENPTFIKKIGDNYYTKNNQLKLNVVIKNIAVISAKNSAGLQDFKHTLLSNNFGYSFKLDEYYTGVQGDNQALSMRDKIIEVYNSQKKYDILVLTRGGGADTDFLIFDNYFVCQAIAKFPIPILTGIGHQKNTTIADLMSNIETKTPTKAAEFIISHNRLFEDDILLFQKSIIIKSQQLFSIHYQTLYSVNSLIVNKTRFIINNLKDNLIQIKQVTINSSKSIIFNNKNQLISISSELISKPKIILYNRINDIKNTINNLSTFKSQFLKNQRGYLGHYISIINLMSPTNILKKGFAIVKYNNKTISKPDEIKIGNDIDIILSSTKINTTVKNKTNYNGTEFNL